jgi:hypothetical protein
MRRLSCWFFLLALALWAADFWQTKPYTDWSDKDVQKMMNNSPWARSISIPMGSGPVPPTLARKGGGDIGAGDAGAAGAPPPISEGGGGGRGGFGGGAGFPQPGGAAAEPSMNVILRWSTALPMKQAVARAKYGAEAKTSPDAQKFLAQNEPSYIVSLSGLPSAVAMGPAEKTIESLKDQTALTVKGKEPLKPGDVQLSPHDRLVDIYFLFPKTTPFSLDDKEIEFSSKVGTIALKQKFKLKDMAVNGKLEL